MKTLFALLILLALPSAALAQTPPPKFGVEVKPDRSVRWHALSARYDGCWDPEYQGYDDLNASCVTLSLSMTKGGKTIHPALETEIWGTTNYFKWSCQRSGKWDWKITYTNTSVPGNPAYIDSKSGTFRIARCRKPTDRRVGRGTVSAAAANDISDSEFVSSVQCSPTSPAVSGKAFRWRCATTHNNTYRECVDTDTYTFITKYEWGKPIKDYRISASRKSCRYF
jgi:hypothetical protein